MTVLWLVRPSASYRDAFLRCAQDHVERANDPARTPEYERALADFDTYVAELRHFAADDEPRPGLVRQHNFWLTDGVEVLGHLRLRPRLNERLRFIGGNIGYDVPPSRRGRGHATRMLALGLGEAAREGLQRAWLTTDAGNAISQRVIERNGGVLDDEYEYEGVVRRRYWIDVTPFA